MSSAKLSGGILPKVSPHSLSMQSLVYSLSALLSYRCFRALTCLQIQGCSLFRYIMHMLFLVALSRFSRLFLIDFVQAARVLLCLLAFILHV